MERKFKFGLLPRVVIAIGLGIILGKILPESVVRIFSTYNNLFGEFLSFTVPLIILGLVTAAIADMGRGAGKMLAITAAIAYLATLISGFFAYFIGSTIFPKLIDPNAAQLATEGTKKAAETFFTISMPPLMGVMTALILSFMVGLGLARLKGEGGLKQCAFDFRDIINWVIEKAIIPLLPWYILAIFTKMTYEGEVFRVLGVFIKIIGIIFAATVVLLIFQYVVAGLISRKNPFRALWNMLPAYFTALGTASSAATIPVTLRQTIKNKVNEDVAGFTVPLCATIHLSGSTLKIVSCAIALMLMHSMPFNIQLFAGFIMMLGITMVAAPGVPGGAIMAAIGVLGSILGFDSNMQGLMIALYITMDSFGTACNVTGDGAIAMIMDRIVNTEKMHKKKEKSIATEGLLR